MSFTIFAMMVGSLSFSSAPAIATDLAANLNVGSHGLILAQQFQNVDLIANMQNGWTDFLQTGKAGALAVGLVLGYTIRGITR